MKSYIHPHNGQGMGIPDECTRFECLPSLLSGEVFAPRLVLKRFGKVNYWSCPACGYTYGTDEERP